MKTVIAIVCFAMFSSFHSTAQDTKTNGLTYQNLNFGMGVGMGREIAVGLFTTVTFTNRFYGGIHCLATSVGSKNVPDNYIRGFRLFSTSNRIERDQFASYSLLIGKCFQKDQSAFSVSVETGVSWVRYSYALFSRKRQTPGFFGPSGDFDGYDTHNLTGLLLSGRLGYRVDKGINLELATYAIRNSGRSIITENLSIVFDLFKKHLRKSKATKAGDQQTAFHLP